MSLPANQSKFKFAWLLSENCLPDRILKDENMSWLGIFGYFRQKGGGLAHSNISYWIHQSDKAKTKTKVYLMFFKDKQQAKFCLLKFCSYRSPTRQHK